MAVLLALKSWPQSPSPFIFFVLTFTSCRPPVFIHPGSIEAGLQRFTNHQSFRPSALIKNYSAKKKFLQQKHKKTQRQKNTDSQKKTQCFNFIKINAKNLQETDVNSRPPTGTGVGSTGGGGGYRRFVPQNNPPPNGGLCISANTLNFKKKEVHHWWNELELFYSKVAYFQNKIHQFKNVTKVRDKKTSDQNQFIVCVKCLIY